MVDFYQTRMGQVFFQGTMPRLLEAVLEIAKELKRHNDLKEAEMATSEEEVG